MADRGGSSPRSVGEQTWRREFMEGEQTWPIDEELAQGQWGNNLGVLSLRRGNKHGRQRRSLHKVSGVTIMAA